MMVEQVKDPYKKEQNFFETPLYRYGVPALLAVLLIALYIYTISDPILTEETALEAVPGKLPDRESGKLLYLQHCSGCHAVDGTGSGKATFKSEENGKLYRSANFLDRSFMRRHSPAIFFSAISNGRFDIMPGFKQRFSDERSWDVTFYVYLLSNDSETVEQGRSEFQKNCARCHGDDGRKTSALTDMSRYVKFSDNEIVESFAGGPDAKLQSDAHLRSGITSEAAILDAMAFARFVPFATADAAEGAESTESTKGEAD